MRKRSAVVGAGAMVLSGAIVAVVPATLLAAAARTFDIDQQAVLAVSLSAGALVAAIANAALLESRLAQPSLRDKTYLPLWATVLGLIGGILIAILPSTLWAVSLGAPLGMVALQLGRTHAIHAHRWRSELVAAALLGLGCSISLTLAFEGSEVAALPVGLAVAAAILARAWASPWRVDGRADLETVAWVGLETAVVAATPFVLTIAVLGFVGPGEAVAFRLILTVLGVLQPVLGYLRTRLLGAHSRGLTIAMSVLTILALASVVVLHLLGVFGLVFGTAWDSVSTTALTLACSWKLLSVPATLPFANMRRKGAVREVFVVRTASTLIYIGLGLAAAATFRSTEAVFVAFLLAEVATFALYAVVDNRTGVRRLDPSLIRDA